ncbi:MAG: MFS transporter [Actinomycetota bacterium]
MSQALHNARSEPATRASASGRALVAACAGNLVEWYDFAVYGAFATVIAATFFPGSDPSARLLARVLTRATLEGWGWRLAFLVTLPLGLVGLYLRRRLDETPRFRAVQRARAVVRRPVAEAVRGYPGRLLAGLALVAALALTFNLFFYLPSYLVTALAVPLPRALAASLAGLALVAIAAPFLGRLSDRVGRRPLLVAGTLALLVVTLPAFLLIRGAGPLGLPLGYVLVGLPLSCLVIVPPFLAELFPTPIRSTALAITYGVGSALFGGTAPFLATLLVRRTGNPVTPAFYAVAVAVAAVVAALLTRETAFRPLDTD